MTRSNKLATEKMVIGAILTALVVILQYLGSFIRFGPFSISLVMIPIVIGAATCGKFVGAWLGFMFGVAVLLSGDAAAFLAVNAFGTVATVLLKGTACGYCAAVCYETVIRITNGRYPTVATVFAAVICPVVNTGVFLLGCLAFFMPTLNTWAGGENVGTYIVTAFIGVNFLIELCVNIVLSPVIVRILKAIKRK